MALGNWKKQIQRNPSSFTPSTSIFSSFSAPSLWEMDEGRVGHHHHHCHVPHGSSFVLACSATVSAIDYLFSSPGTSRESGEAVKDGPQIFNPEGFLPLFLPYTHLPSQPARPIASPTPRDPFVTFLLPPDGRPGPFVAIYWNCRQEVEEQ